MSKRVYKIKYKVFIIKLIHKTNEDNQMQTIQQVTPN